MTPRRRILVIAACVLSLTVRSIDAGGRPQDPVSGVEILEKWVAAVEGHTPGRPDEAVAMVAALSFQNRADLNKVMGLFFAVLTSKQFTGSKPVEKHIVAMGLILKENPGRDVFLKRAVVLHSDTAIFRDKFPEPVEPPSVAKPDRVSIDPNGGAMKISGRDEDRQPPLLTRSRVILDKDGQVLGDQAVNWNWPFARSLLDFLSTNTGSTPNPTQGPCRGAECVGRVSRSSSPAADPFPAAWYHATTAYMFANGLYGDATAHLRGAGEARPDDPLILFDRACYAEILGLPMHQILLGDTASASHSGTNLNIPGQQKTNAEAERLFRRALEVDPSLVEARVRLARLLDLRNQHEEAAAELATALAAKPAGFVAFYAHLFAGRAAQALGRIDEAARHYDEAIALFPDAQSALLARSQAALLGSDVPGVLAPVQHLGPRSLVFESDPWWQYQLAAGRDQDALMLEVWTAVRR